jgi:hypothetical protein
MLADFYITDDSNDAVLTKAMFKSSQLCKNFDAAIDAMFGYNYCIQIIKTGFAE